MTTIERDVKRTYIVSDYDGFEARFTKLKDARDCLKSLGEGRFTIIEAETIEIITIKTKQVIQSLR